MDRYFTPGSAWRSVPEPDGAELAGEGIDGVLRRFDGDRDDIDGARAVGDAHPAEDIGRKLVQKCVDARNVAARL